MFVLPVECLFYHPLLLCPKNIVPHYKATLQPIHYAVPMSQGAKLNLITWNCRGLKHLRKVKQAVNKLKETYSKIVLLKEAHLHDDNHLGVRKRWRGNAYTAPFSSQSRGVMTLIHESVPFQMKIIKDKRGGFRFRLQGDGGFESELPMRGS